MLLVRVPPGQPLVTCVCGSAYCYVCRTAGLPAAAASHIIAPHGPMLQGEGAYALPSGACVCVCVCVLVHVMLLCVACARYQRVLTSSSDSH